MVLTPDAAQQLERLPRTIRARVLAFLERLQNWPEVSGAKSLTGDLAGWYRLGTAVCCYNVKQA